MIYTTMQFYKKKFNNAILIHYYFPLRAEIEKGLVINYFMFARMLKIMCIDVTTENNSLMAIITTPSSAA